MTTVIDDKDFRVSFLQLIKAMFQAFQDFPKFGIGLCLREPLECTVCQIYTAFDESPTCPTDDLTYLI